MPPRLGCALLVALCSLAAPAAAASEAAKGTPVSRVVELLSRLQAKLEADLKAEGKAFSKYKCWYTTVKDAKEASNAAASSRISSLTSYIDDIEAGRIEFTTERVELEKQIAGLTGDLQQAADIRAKEASDFQAAEKELEQAIAALAESIGVLSDAGAGAAALSQQGTRLRTRWSLRQALRYARGSLSGEDSKLLEGLVAGEVPTKDWKKLNREATFKKKYEARSGGIAKLLKELEATFSKNLDEAKQKEEEAQSTYESLKASKEKMLEKAQAALVEMAEEHGARGLSKAEAQEELDALEAQVDADGDFLKNVKSAFETKEGEWQAREALRQKELTAMSEAISVLHSDDARDQFTKAYSTPGVSLLQALRPRRHRRAGARRGHRHAAKAVGPHELAALAESTGDRRLAAVASLGASSASIESVVAAIDSLVAVLQSEEKQDLETKEKCEADLSSTSRQSLEKSRSIDGLTDDIARKNDKIAELEGEIEEQEKAISESNSSLLELVRQREDERALFKATKQDDLEAVAIIDQALQVLEKMVAEITGSSAATLLSISRHADAGRGSEAQALPIAPAANADAKTAEPQGRGAAPIASALSLRARRQPIEVVAGEAPPPPPATWANPTYSGASGEHDGILSILGLVKQDLEHDITLAEEADAKSEEDFEGASAELEEAMQDARDAISAYEGEKATNEQSVVDKGTARTTAKGELESTMAMLKDMQPGCDYALINYDVRVKKRHIEIDGLTKAKAYLQGGKFAA